MKKFLAILMVLALAIIPVSAFASGITSGTQSIDIAPTCDIIDPGLIRLQIDFDQPTLIFNRSGSELRVQEKKVQFTLTNTSIAGTTPVSGNTIKLYFNGTLNIRATANFDFSGTNVTGKLNTPSEYLFPLPNRDLGVGNIDNVTNKFSFTYNYADNGAPLSEHAAVEDAVANTLPAAVTFHITPIIAPRF